MGSAQFLTKYGLCCIYDIDDEVKPDFYERSFIEIFPFLENVKCVDDYCCIKISELKSKLLYRHQLECYDALKSGLNVVLVSGTGSGKTEAWAFYAIERCLQNQHRSFKILAIYPTIALEKDQGIRLKCYFESLGLNVLIIDAKRYEELVSKYGKEGIRRLINSANLVLTNPAFFMTEVKNGFRRLGSFIRNVDLIVIDELDYYGSKRATLLIKLLEITSKYFTRKSFQVVITTATLDRPESLVDYLRKITGRETRVISGKPFRSKNITYVIVGKVDTLTKLYNELKQYKDVFVKYFGPDYEHIFSNFETFISNIFRLRYDLIINPLPEEVEKIMENKWGLLFEFREPYDDEFIELITDYINDDGLTIVFCRDIKEANIIHRRVIQKCIDRTGNPNKCEFLIRVHHHLIDPKEREEIEKFAREGQIKIIVSVKTLAQGIDIGFAKRIIHTYIPFEVRDFIQKEGRKGRREGMISETIIFPFGNWYIFVNGFESFRKWLEMGAELLIVNPENYYVKLFHALYKQHKRRSRELTPEEKVLINGVAKLCDTRKEWRKINFYEHSPAYSIPVKYIEIEGDRITSKLSDVEISHRDLVEKYQPGFIDYSDFTVALTNAEKFEGGVRKVVYKLSLRDFQRLIVEPYLEHDAGKYIYSIIGKLLPSEVPKTDVGALIEAIGRYVDVRKDWFEDADLVRDVSRGKIWSIVSIYHKFNPIIGNFARHVEKADGIYWIVESLRKHAVTLGETIVWKYLKKIVPVDTKVRWTYDDYTYVYEYVLDPLDSKESTLFEIGLVYLLTLFRKYLHVPINLLNYVIEPYREKEEEQTRERYLLRIWENEATGVIELLKKGELKIGDKIIDCKVVYDYIINDEPDELTEVLMSQINCDLVYEMKVRKIDWDTVKRYAIRALSYICEIPYIQLRGEISRKCKVVTLERPRKELGVIAFDSIELLIEGKPIKLCALFNGEEFECEKCDEIETTYIKFVRQMPQVTFVHFGKDEKELCEIFKHVRLERVENTYEILKNALPGVKELPISLYEVCRLLIDYVRGVEIGDLKPILDELMYKVHEYKREKDEQKKGEIYGEILELAKRYLKISTYTIYMLYLMLTRLKEICKGESLANESKYLGNSQDYEKLEGNIWFKEDT